MISLVSETTPPAPKAKRKLPAGLIAYQAKKKAEKEAALKSQGAPKPAKATKPAKKPVKKRAVSTLPKKQNAVARPTARRNSRFYL